MQNPARVPECSRNSRLAGRFHHIGTGFIISFFGNILPIPFILLLINKIFEWLKKIPGIKKPIIWLEEKTLKKRDKIDKYGIWGLLIFVAIPLPGTGAWTGSLLASLLNLDRKKSFGVISIGVFIAGLIISVASAVFNVAMY